MDRVKESWACGLGRILGSGWNGLCDYLGQQGMGNGYWIGFSFGLRSSIYLIRTKLVIPKIIGTDSVNF